MSSSQANPDAAASTSGVRQRQVNKDREQLEDQRGPVESSADTHSGDEDEDAPPKATKTYGRTPEGTSKLFSFVIAINSNGRGQFPDRNRLY